MRKFMTILLMTGTFLGGYYLGRLPGSPDIFGWTSAKCSQTRALCDQVSDAANHSGSPKSLGFIGQFLHKLSHIGGTSQPESQDERSP
jgi:hypothetical protein